MSDKKISQLTSLAQGDIATTTDVLAIVDTSATETKKATPAAIVGAAAAAGLTNVDINSGAIDGTAIGANSASTGAFTTLSASSSVTLSGGTANGVLYLNGSKVATSGANLTYDGTTFTSVGQINVKNDLLLSDATAIQGRAYGDASGVVWRAESGLAQRWHIGSSEQMRLTSTGLGIGTSSPVGKLQVTGSLASFILNTSGTEFYNNYAGQVKIYASNASGFLSFGASGRDNDVVLSTSGNLGIGTSSPAVPLDVVSNSGSNGINIRARSSNDYGFLNFKSNDGSDTAGSIAALRAGVNSGSLLFYTGTTEKARLDTSGNLGIGTSSPSYKLDVAGDARSNSWIGRANGSAPTADCAVFRPADNSLGFSTANTERARLDSSGNLGLGVTPSAWSSSVASQVGYGAALSSRSAGNTASDMTHGAYWNGTNWLYQHSSVGAARYQMTGANAGSTHAWFVSAGGTAGNAISFTQAMTLDASGNLLVGATSSGWAASGRQTVEVNGSSSALVGLRIATALSGYMFHDGTDMGVANSQNGYLRFITNNTERARIDASGNLGVGTSSPSAFGLLAVVKDQTADTAIVVGNGGTSNAATTMSFALSESGIKQGWLRRYRDGTANTEIGFSDALLFTGNVTGTKAERARITSGGDFLVGTTTAGANIGFDTKFAVDGGSGETSIFKTSAGNNAYCQRLWNTATTGDNLFAWFATESAGTTRGSITYNRGAGQVAYNTTSDARLKENIVDAEEAGSKIDAMQVRQFDWKETGNHLDYGFVAQELHAVAPHAVSKPEDEDAMWSVDYSKLVPMLVKEIQSLRARVAQLEAK